MENTSEGALPQAEQAGFGIVDPATNEGLEAEFAGGGPFSHTLSPVVDEGNLAYEPKPLSLGKILAYSSGNLGKGFFIALNSYLQQVLLISLGASPVVYGLLGNQRSFEGAIIQPLVGAWSDRSKSRFGRRRVFILRFLPICIFLTVLTPFIPGFVGADPILGIDPKLFSLILVGACIFLFSVLYNISDDPYSALMADIAPQRQRGAINGVAQSIFFVGNISVLLVFILLHVPFTVLYPLAGAALLIFFLPTVLGIREPKKLPSANEHKRYKVRDYWRALGADRQLQLYYAVQFFLWIGINSVQGYITPYAIAVVHLDPFAAATLPLVLVVAIALAAWPLGVLSGRLSLKGVFFLGLLMMAGATITAVFRTDLISLYVILAVAGVGYAATQATGYPLLTRLVYPDQMGVYTGLNSTVTSIALPVSTLIAGTIVQTIGFNFLFAVVGIAFTLGLIPLVLLRVDRSVVVRARAAAAAAAGLAAA